MNVLKGAIPTLLAVSLLVLTACQTVESEPPQKRIASSTSANSAAELYAEITRAIGTPEAQDIASCKMASFGAKACGGPESYLIYSTESTDEASLLELISRYNMLAKTRNKQEGLVSNCAVVMPPQITLKNGVCVSSQATSDYY